MIDRALRVKIIVSACLLGEYCRYDGETKKDTALQNYINGHEIIPFCPEAPIFGTPREKINVMQINGEYKIMTDKTDRDVTKKLENEINHFIEQNPHADVIILKSKSPSCGFGTTPILNVEKQVVCYGNGIAANSFLRRYHNTTIKDENSIKD